MRGSTALDVFLPPFFLRRRTVLLQCDRETHAARVSVRVDRGQCRAPRRKSEGPWQVCLCSSFRGSTACCEVPCPESSRPGYFCVLRRAATRVAGCSEGNVAVGDEAIRFGKAPWQMHRKASKGCWGAVRFAVPVEEPYSKLASARWRGRPWCSSQRAPLHGATPMTAGRGAYPGGFFGGLLGRGYLDPIPPVLSLGTGGGS